MTRPRLLSTEISMSSSKTHRRTSSVICNGKIHSGSDRSFTVDMMDCCISPDVGKRPVHPSSEIISSLRALELIRQLSFDTNTPKIIDISDTQNMIASPSTLSKYLPDLLECECAPPAPPSTPPMAMASPQLPPIIGRMSPPINHVVVHNLNRSGSTSLSEISDSDGYVTDFDGMMMGFVRACSSVLIELPRVWYAFHLSPALRLQHGTAHPHLWLQDSLQQQPNADWPWKQDLTHKERRTWILSLSHHSILNIIMCGNSIVTSRQSDKQIVP